MSIYHFFIGSLMKSSSTVVFNTEAMSNANCKVGSYLSFSMAFIVCLDTLQSLASSSCDNLADFLNSLMWFFI